MGGHFQRGYAADDDAIFLPVPAATETAPPSSVGCAACSARGLWKQERGQSGRGRADLQPNICSTRAFSKGLRWTPTHDALGARPVPSDGKDAQRFPSKIVCAEQCHINRCRRRRSSGGSGDGQAAVPAIPRRAAPRPDPTQPIKPATMETDRIGLTEWSPLPRLPGYDDPILPQCSVGQRRQPPGRFVWVGCRWKSVVRGIRCEPITASRRVMPARNFRGTRFPSGRCDEGNYCSIREGRSSARSRRSNEAHRWRTRNSGKLGSGTAAKWSQALEAESPDDARGDQKITAADVNRVAGKYLVNDTAVVAILTPRDPATPSLPGLPPRHRVFRSRRQNRCRCRWAKRP